MDGDKVDLIYKFLIALSASVFGVAVAVTAQHIRLIGVPKSLLITAIITQAILSLGIFLGIMLAFKSGFLPEVVPNDDWSALTAAYLLSSIPHIVVATALTIYNKEINKWLQERYGKDTHMPSIDTALQKNTQDTASTESNNPITQAQSEIEKEFEASAIKHKCESCGHELEADAKASDAEQTQSTESK